MLYHEGEYEASLRRAISACYYSVFHALAASGASAFSAPQTLRRQLERSYDHSGFLAAAKDVEKRQPPAANKDLLELARAFRRLQEQRVRADYDLATTLTWEEADEVLDEADRALNAIKRLAGSSDLAEFVLYPLLQRRRGGG